MDGFVILEMRTLWYVPNTIQYRRRKAIHMPCAVCTYHEHGVVNCSLIQGRWKQDGRGGPDCPTFECEGGVAPDTLRTCRCTWTQNIGPKFFVLRAETVSIAARPLFRAVATSTVGPFSSRLLLSSPPS